jgi:glycosyltransferase involved in cell wall biosynthesis
MSSFRAGGGEKQMVEIANALAARGHRIDLLVLKPVGQLTDRVSPNVRVVSLDVRRMALSLLPLMAYLRRERPAVLLALDEYSHLLSLIARILTRTSTKIILRIGNMLTELFARYEGKSRLMPFLIRRLYKKADAVVANSKGVADNVCEVTGIAREKVLVILNPKDLAAIRAQAQKPAHAWLMKKTLPVVVAVGRLRVQKNFSLIIRSFAAMLPVLPARLLIVGGGREEPRLRALIEELKVGESVELVGYTDNPYAYMAKADVFVSASLWEGLPNALMEAMVCGVPVIAADCSSGPRELLAPGSDYTLRLKKGLEQARYGILTAVNDEKALVEALGLLLSDEALRRHYGQAAKERSEDFDAKDAIDKYVQALHI